MENISEVITNDQILSLMEKYDINKATLSQLLGWGQNTISRYLSNESSPSIQYSTILKKLNDPSEMRSLLNNHSYNIPSNIVEKLHNKITEINFKIIEADFTGEVFIKKLNFQELGYRKGLPLKAGAYLLVPKATIDFFPQLSSEQLNDNTTLHVRIAELNKEVDVTYTYHNSKYASPLATETRDEYRLYLSHLDIFAPDDIAVFIKSSTPNSYTVYKISKDNTLNILLSSIIQDYKIGRASSALVPIAVLVANRVNIAELYSAGIASNASEELLEQPIFSNGDDAPGSTSDSTDIDELFSQGLLSSNLDTFVSVVHKLKRNQKFRKVVLDAYDNKCCVSCNSIGFNKLSNLQAAHIVPKHLKGSDNPTNGLPLSQDLHWAFDNGFFTINNDYTIEVHEKVLLNPALSMYHKNKIFLPSNPRFYPDLEALSYHKANVFGNFLNR